MRIKNENEQLRKDLEKTTNSLAVMKGSVGQTNEQEVEHLDVGTPFNIKKI